MQTKPTSLFSWPLVGVLVLLFMLSLGGLLYGNYTAGDSALWQMIVNGLILSLPLALLFGLTGVLIVAARQKKQGAIDQRLARLIYWSPRAAGIAIIFFVSLFALDSFSPEYTLGEMLLGFLMHMLPSIGMIILLVIAWRWEWVGFAAFLLAALFFMRTLLGGLDQALGMFLLFSGPMLLISLLFGANWRWRNEIRPPLN